MNNRNPINSANRSVRLQQNIASGKRFRHRSALSQRAQGLEKSERSFFAPPEDWYEPGESPKRDPASYRIIVHAAGRGYRHVVTPKQIRERLAKLPTEMIEPLEVVQLSQMTRKKQSFPCYGMQWGTTLYLYPIEPNLIEFYGRPPKPCQMNEARMYGGRWLTDRDGNWRLVWTEAAIRDYYLNNVLIHELGHLLDQRNNSYVDRERYAEWFAIEHGYRKSRQDARRDGRRRKSKPVVRRHHGT